VEGLGEKPSSSASVFFFLPLICDIKNLTNSSQKTGKLVKLTQGKKNFPKFLVKKDSKFVVGKSLLYTYKNFISLFTCQKTTKKPLKDNNKKHMFVEANILG
jgi:hypothetical protein